MIKVPKKVFQTSLKAIVLTAGFTGMAQAGPILNAANGHYYEYIYATAGTDYWAAMMTAAASSSYLGTQGYLATVTSAQEEAFVESLLDSVTVESLYANVAIGGSDAASEGVWQWVTGPEAGTQFWQGGADGQSVNGAYSLWEISGTFQRQPDNAGGHENYLAIEINTGAPNWVSNTRYMWNDTGGGRLLGYLVEYDAPVDVPTPAPFGLMFAGLGSMLGFRKLARAKGVVRTSC